MTAIYLCTIKLGCSHSHPCCKSMEIVYLSACRHNHFHTQTKSWYGKQETLCHIEYALAARYIYLIIPPIRAPENIPTAKEMTPTSCSWLHANTTSQWMSQFGGTRWQGIISSISSSCNWSITLSRIISFFKLVDQFAIWLGIWSMLIKSKCRLENHEILNVDWF